MTWKDDAACAGEGPTVFYRSEGEARRGSAGGENTMRLARRIFCDGCPVRSACLEEAVRTGEHFGVWGGTTPGDRGRMRFRSRRENRNLYDNREQLAREIGAWRED